MPRSIEDPYTTNDVNIGGFVNIIGASREAGVRNFVYAGSSATYGDSPTLPKVEHQIGNPLSPYAVTKYVNEVYAGVFRRCYGLNTIGLRYFNVFGPRQDPDGAYAAVIPKWTAAMINGEEVRVNGDGETSRDFCFIANVVQANILAALSGPEAQGQVYNIAVGGNMTLNQLFKCLREVLHEHQIHYAREPVGVRSGQATYATRTPTFRWQESAWAIIQRTQPWKGYARQCHGTFLSHQPRQENKRPCRLKNA